MGMHSLNALQGHGSATLQAVGPHTFVESWPSMPTSVLGGAGAPAPTTAAGQTLRPNGAVATAANAGKGGGAVPAPNAAAGAQPVAPFAPVQGGMKSLLGQ